MLGAKQSWWGEERCLVSANGAVRGKGMEIHYLQACKREKTNELPL